MDDELSGKYMQKKDAIEKRLLDFKNVFRNCSEKELFAELCFCLLTPQSKARICWRAIEKLKENGKLYDGNEKEILAWLAGVRFNIGKSSYIIEARNMFHDGTDFAVREKLPPDGKEAREWLADNVKGMGMKEASHFLRNIGFEGLAILDRHILKHLHENGVIDEAKPPGTRKKYLEIEGKFRAFSESVGIPMDHLDLLWWSQEAGEIFK
ncbi:MAG: N-glycosylase/DNA lyase [Candidatus Aenigmarchaeota archaeon]|nr:N-glycosylase/DNA lyase [Candidatus Aenigmarchaeota archaeon]